MEKMNEIIERNVGLLTSLLIYSEFNFDQAHCFLPHAAHAAMGAVTVSEISVSNSAARALSLSTLLQTVDINALAAKAAIDPQLARAGLVALLPKLLELFGTGVAVADNEVLPHVMSGEGKSPFLFRARGLSRPHCPRAVTLSLLRASDQPNSRTVRCLPRSAG